MWIIVPLFLNISWFYSSRSIVFSLFLCLFAIFYVYVHMSFITICFICLYMFLSLCMYTVSDDENKDDHSINLCKTHFTGLKISNIIEKIVFTIPIGFWASFSRKYFEVIPCWIYRWWYIHDRFRLKALRPVASDQNLPLQQHAVCVS